MFPLCLGLYIIVYNHLFRRARWLRQIAMFCCLERAASVVPRAPASAPKVELHVHLDGSWDGPHLYLMAKKHVDRLPASADVGGTPMPLQQAVRDARSPQDFLKLHVQLPSTTCTLSGFLAPFNWVNTIVRTSFCAEGASALEDFALHFAKRQHESNVVYTEVRWCPHLLLDAVHLAVDCDGEARYAAAKEVLLAVTRGLRRGEAEHHLMIRQILCCLDFLPHVSADIARLLREVGRDCGCVAIDVAGGEGHFSTAPDANACMQAVLEAKREGFGCTIHAGEDVNTGGTASNVRRAIEDYGATRIGHGYQVLTDNAIVQLAKAPMNASKWGVHFECCPTSSFLTGGFGPRPRPWADHPLRHMYAEGLSCSVNSDDPLFCGICLDDEFELCLGEMGLQTQEMHAMTERAIEAAFCTAEDKIALTARVAEFYDRIP